MTAEDVSGSAAVQAFLQQLFPAECHDRVWLAGGTVRDALLQRQIKDIDLVAALAAERLERLGFRPVAGKTTASIWFRNFPSMGNVEITRLDSAADLTADLRRRDFTVNALLLPLTGSLFDPLQGMNDLELRQLRPCSEKTFTADPLRLFRAFRFAAEGFSLTEAASGLIRSQFWEDELRKIPAERFSRELLKALAAPEPQRFFLTMLEFAVGKEWLPELFRMPQVPAGPLRYHPEGDLLTHSLQVLERVAAATASPLARFCAFFHDIGKLATDPAGYPQHLGHDEAGFTMAAPFCRRLALPTEYAQALAWCSRLHGKANSLGVLRAATKIRMAEQAIRGGIVDILPLIAAADKAGEEFSADWLQVVAVARLNCGELGIDAARLTVLKPEKRADFILQKRVERLRSL